MPADRELVFVAGFRPIYGKKLFYFKQKFFTDRTKTPPPTFSDLRTEVKSYAQLFAVHRADRAAAEERLREVQEARAAALPAAPALIEEMPTRLEEYDEPAAEESAAPCGQDETWDEAAANTARDEDTQPQDAEEMTFEQKKKLLLAKRRGEGEHDGT